MLKHQFSLLPQSWRGGRDGASGFSVFETRVTGLVRSRPRPAESSMACAKREGAARRCSQLRGLTRTVTHHRWRATMTTDQMRESRRHGMATVLMDWLPAWPRGGVVGAYPSSSTWSLRMMALLTFRQSAPHDVPLDTRSRRARAFASHCRFRLGMMSPLRTMRAAWVLRSDVGRSSSRNSIVARRPLYGRVLPCLRTQLRPRHRAR